MSVGRSLNEHAEVVLGAIIPQRRDLLDIALRNLTPAHFPDQVQRQMFMFLHRYVDTTGAVLSRASLGDVLRRNGVDAGTVLHYEETYDLFSGLEPTEADFRWSIDCLRDLSAERATKVALTEAMEVLSTGITNDRGHERKGHNEARSYILEKVAEIDRDLQMQAAPEGDIRHEAMDVLAEYNERKAARLAGKPEGIYFGIPSLDAVIGGLKPGELDLLLGYSGEGKTSLACQLAWHACTQQGLNVYIATTETLRPQVRRKVLARHSKDPRFGLPEGLDTRDLKAASLSPQLESKWAEVLNDFTRNPAYGHCYIAQVPRNSTIPSIESRLYRVLRDWRPDLLIIDYLALLKPERSRQSQREELSEIVKDAKVFAATFDDGKGLCVVSPWQVNRQWKDEADRTGYYTLRALSDTSEAEKSSDVIVSLLAPNDRESRYAEVKGQVLKDRDGRLANRLVFDVDYATSTVTDRRGATDTAEVHDLLLG